MMEFNTEITREPAVYMIYERSTDLSYVGSTKDIRERMEQHTRDLRNNRHYNKGLQEIYNRNNGDVSVVVCPTDTKELARQFEQDILDEYLDSGLLVNVSDNSTTHLKGYSQLRKGIPRKPEICKKISLAHIGVPLSEDHKKALSLAKKFPVEVDGKTYANIPAAARELGVSTTEIKHMAGLKGPINSRISIDGVEYNSLREGQDKLGISKSSMMHRLNSESEKYAGYVRITRCFQDKHYEAPVKKHAV